MDSMKIIGTLYKKILKICANRNIENLNSEILELAQIGTDLIKHLGMDIKNVSYLEQFFLIWSEEWAKLPLY